MKVVNPLLLFNYSTSSAEDLNLIAVIPLGRRIFIVGFLSGDIKTILSVIFIFSIAI